jgi:hypothetical protein
MVAYSTMELDESQVTYRGLMTLRAEWIGGCDRDR